MLREPLVSIIISNFRDIRNLRLCLKSIKDNAPLKFVEVIVVDYGTDGLEEIIRKDFSFVKLIKLKKDYGVPAQRNIGALLSKGKYLFFLDNDTYVCRDCIENLLSILRNDPSIAVAQPKTLALNNPQYINTTGGFLNVIGVPQLRGYLEKDKDQYNCLDDIFYAQNSGFIIRRDVFMHVGMYDSSYYFYFDETDLCFRVWLHGYRVVYVPIATILHRVSSIRNVNPLKVFYYERNKIITLIKNFELGHMLIFVPIAMLYSIIERLFSAIAKRKPEVLLVTIMSHVWVLKHLKDLIEKRYFVQHKVRKVSDHCLMRKGVLKWFI